MSVNEVLNGLGSWSIGFRDRLPDEIAQAIQFFGHVAVVEGTVNVDLTGDSLLTAARYVGVLKSRDLATGRTIGGDSMEQWLGDEDDKGAVFETAIVKTNGTLGQWLASILPVAVQLGTVHDPGGTWSGKIQWVSPRTALQTVCDAFGVTYRVNGNGTLDVGTAAQLYRTVPRTNDVDPIIVRNGAGVDLDVAALGGTPDVADDVRDYSSRIVLVGQTQADGTFAIGSQNAPSVPYVDRWGNVVQRTRLISETGTETGSVASRAQLQLNRYNRILRVLKLDSGDYEIAGDVKVGDTVWLYDPDAGIVNPANEITFRGEVLHPDKIGVTGLSWPVVEGMTVAYRAPDGTWYDLTRFVTYETATLAITVGDLPRSLTSAGSNPVVDRQDTAPDQIAPGAPTGLALSTTSFLNGKGGNAAVITASWTAPTTNADGSALADLAYYIVQWRPDFRSQWQTTYSDVTQIDLPAAIGLLYDVRVAAVDRSQNISAYTATAQITTAADTVPPPAPADPVVGNYIGQLRIEYAGTDSTGAAMPADAQRIDVEVSSASGGPFVVVSQLDPRVPGKAYVDAPYGVTRYVRLRAYDNSQNGSAYSAVISGSTAQAGDGDIASMNVGKLLAGTISVDVLISTRLTTALTGQRAEHNAAGFQVWDASNNKVVDLNGSANLLTGTLQSALSGRRFVAGAAGNLGSIQFIAPDGTISQIQGYTSALAGSSLEAIRLNVPVSGTANTWNTFSLDSGERVFTVSGAIYEYIGDGGAPGITSGYHIWWMPNRGTPSTNLPPSGSVSRLWLNVADELHYFPSGTTGYWMEGTTGAGNHRFYDDTNRLRFYIENSSNKTWLMHGATGTFGYTQLLPGAYASGSVASPSLLLATAQVGGTGLSYGGGLVYTLNNDGSDQSISARNADFSTWIPIKASAFTVSSDVRGKIDEGLATLPALDLLAATPVRAYRLKDAVARPLDVSDDPGEIDTPVDAMNPEEAARLKAARPKRKPSRRPAKAPKPKPGPVTIGLFAHEAPEQIRHTDHEGRLGVDLYQYIALCHKAIVELKARLDEKEGAA